MQPIHGDRLSNLAAPLPSHSNPLSLKHPPPLPPQKTSLPFPSPPLPFLSSSNTSPFPTPRSAHPLPFPLFAHQLSLPHLSSPSQTPLPLLRLSLSPSPPPPSPPPTTSPLNLPQPPSHSLPHAGPLHRPTTRAEELLFAPFTFHLFNRQLPTMMLLLSFPHTLHVPNRLLHFTLLLVMLFLARPIPVVALSPPPLNLTAPFFPCRLPAYRNVDLANCAAALCCDLAM